MNTFFFMHFRVLACVFIACHAINSIANDDLTAAKKNTANAVNTANMGPYGDAITYELIPEIEKQFRGIGKGYARFMYGGSAGGR